MPPCMTRLIDGLSSFFESVLEFKLHSFGRRPRDNSYFDAIELDRMDAIVAVLGNVEIINPVKQILNGIGFEDTFAEKERLLSIAFPNREKERKNKATTESRKPEDIKFTLQKFLDLEEHFRQKPDESFFSSASPY